MVAHPRYAVVVREGVPTEASCAFYVMLAGQARVIQGQVGGVAGPLLGPGVRVWVRVSVTLTLTVRVWVRVSVTLTLTLTLTRSTAWLALSSGPGTASARRLWSRASLGWPRSSP